MSNLPSSGSLLNASADSKNAPNSNSVALCHKDLIDQTADCIRAATNVANQKAEAAKAAAKTANTILDSTQKDALEKAWESQKKFYYAQEQLAAKELALKNKCGSASAALIEISVQPKGPKTNIAKIQLLPPSTPAGATPPPSSVAASANLKKVAPR